MAGNQGGARPGAGRKKGSVSRIDEEARRKAAEGGIMPLDYLLGILRDETLLMDLRMDAAKAAAPYVHAKLSAIESTGGGPIRYEVSWLGEGEEEPPPPTTAG
jgi:hypothetical protein